MRRHDLISVAAADWEAMLTRHPGLNELPLVRDWVGQGWPVIIRRPLPGEDAGSISAALPLPPRFGKRRVGFSLDLDASIAAVPAVTLAEAASVAPAAWHDAIAALLALGRDLDLTPRVFGALLWEKLTGLAYLTDNSDLDLLWHVDDDETATRLLAGLQQIESRFPVRLDGELVLPDGAGVNWRELAACGADGHGSVLAKSMHSVSVRDATRLFAPIPCSV